MAGKNISSSPTLPSAELPGGKTSSLKATWEPTDRQAYNAYIEQMRDEEYPMLSGKHDRRIDESAANPTGPPDQIYLDHAGMALPAKSLIDSFARIMSSNIFGNPHSAFSASQFSTTTIEGIRIRVLRMFNADPAEYDLIFVANATAGVKLLAECLRSAPEGFDYVYHQSSHTSLVGLRQEAQNSVCVENSVIDDWLAGGPPPLKSNPKRLTLFSFPAQSNFDGTCFPLNWPRRYIARTHTVNAIEHFSLLDAAAYVSTKPLDFSIADEAPDFTVLSFYKIFGFPDLGGLVVRRQTAPALHNRRYFGGGTVESVVCQNEPWYARKEGSIHDALEDGTLPIHSIMALGLAMDTHRRLFHSMQEVSQHTTYLSSKARHELGRLRHGNGALACVVYSTASELATRTPSGPVVAFNLLTDTGEWVSPDKFQKLADLKGFHTRTGSVCNPGGTATALSLSPTDIKKNFSQGFRCGNENDIIHGKPTGVIRISIGAMSTESDLDRFMAFVRDFYTSANMSPDFSRGPKLNGSNMFVEDIVVYPIKSCQGYHVPRGQSWEIGSSGLMWDREWCLVNRATNRVLSQKRYPRMALLRPVISLDRNEMRIYGSANASEYSAKYISIQLSHPMKPSCPNSDVESAESTVQGIGMPVQEYVSPVVNEFFSNSLGVPCVLARTRCYSEMVETHERRSGPDLELMPGTFPSQSPVPGALKKVKERPIRSLSNESPILAINWSSVQQLNKEIEATGGQPVPTDSFRANLILRPREPYSKELAYCEDDWAQLQIAGLKFNILGPCQRCHMVCIDPKTAAKSPEPYVTLSRTRRFGNNIFFGSHLTTTNSNFRTHRAAKVAAIKAGDDAMAI